MQQFSQHKECDSDADANADGDLCAGREVVAFSLIGLNKLESQSGIERLSPLAMEIAVNGVRHFLSVERAAQKIIDHFNL